MERQPRNWTRGCVAGVLAVAVALGCDVEDDDGQGEPGDASSTAGGKADDAKPNDQEPIAPTCTEQELAQDFDALWRAYVALENGKCIDLPQGEGCEALTSDFEGDAEGYFDCNGSITYQATCEALERSADGWKVWVAAHCNPAAKDDHWQCRFQGRLIVYTQTRSAELGCKARPSEGECGAQQRDARVQAEGQRVSGMIDDGCLADGYDSDACAEHLEAWKAIKEVNATCNAEQYVETLCGYFTRKQAKAANLVATICEGNDLDAKGPSVFPDLRSYCAYNQLHVDYYGDRRSELACGE